MTGTQDDIAFRGLGISKSFPGVRALSDVDIDLKKGEVHALVGENGAGKSTLARIIAGIEKTDDGQMVLGTENYAPSGRRDAESRGVRIVMQELNLVSNLSIAENIFLKKLPSRFGFIRYSELNRAARELTEQVGLEVDVRTPIARLGVGRQQMVEIAAGLSQQCRILILDEPTASLTDKETDLLFAQIEKLKRGGVSILYISHHIEEILRITDRVTVLRDGRAILTEATARLDADTIVRTMVGRQIEKNQLRHRAQVGGIAMHVEGLSRGRKVRSVSFTVRRGQIVGIAGLMGSGRTETMRLIFGADRADAGKIRLYDSQTPVRISSPRQAVRHGIALVTEDRKQQGLLLPLPISRNISLVNLRPLSTLGWVSVSKERCLAAEYVSKLSVRSSSTEQTAGTLSGGNQQKVVIAKWLYRDCSILIFDEPTRGIDVGAKFEIYRILDELASQGKAILVVSSDLKELMAISDRILVMSDGKMVEEFNDGRWSQESIAAAAFSEYVKQNKGRNPA
jgi:ribose transport system ATP-binding protein